MATKFKRVISLTLLFLLIFQFSFTADAADNNLNEANYYEIGVGSHDLTGGFSDWSEIYAKGSWQRDANNILTWEILNAERFNETGTLFVGGITHTFNEDVYGSLYLSTSDDVFFFPKFRIDAYINKKFLKERNLVGTLGVYYEDANTINEESGIYLGATYYFSSPWIVEAGIKKNRSKPGPEYSTRYKIAVTYGEAFDRYIIAEIDWGNEAYQYVTETTAAIDVDSTVYRLTWREWVKKDWGFNIVGEHYTSDTYDRDGVMFGVFKHF